MPRLLSTVAVIVTLLASIVTAQQVVPAAADTVAATGSPAEKLVILDFQQLGQCTQDAGMSPAAEVCQTQASLTAPGQEHWYRFNVLQDVSAFTLHFLARVQNGRIRMGLWFPGQLFDRPGIYMLQIVNEYGSPEYSLTADMTPATTLLADTDRHAVGQIFKDCCPTTDGNACYLLSQALSAASVEADLCHQGPVRCDKQGHVTDLVLQGTNTDTDLTCNGFSAAFANLPALVRLDLAGANLGADLATIGDALLPAQSLKWLVLRTAGILGKLNCDVLLPSLQLLSLTRNELTGTIPSCFTQSTTLRHLYLSDNALSGPLPDFSPDSSLQLLFARDQVLDGKPSLRGSLPASVATATALQYLQLSDTGLVGGIPDLPANLKYFNVSSNGLKGPLPHLPSSLVSLDVSANDLTGGFPSNMAAFTSLVDIQAYSNKFDGPLPAKMPPNLVQLAAAGNQLKGSLPVLPRGTKYISLSGNKLCGPLPDGPSAARLWFADFSSNSFSGLLPASLGQSDALVYLNVSGNQLEGIASSDAWSTPACITLDASNNNIAGSVPAQLAVQPSLAYINLAFNQLSGNLDSFAKALTPGGRVGGVFDVSNNQLTGDLPEGLVNLAAFSAPPVTFPSWNEVDSSGFQPKVFNVANNSLSGPFPAFITNSLTGLVSQHCSDNPGSCNLAMAVDGGNNKLSCPNKLQGDMMPQDFTLLASQQLGCGGNDGVTYEVASVLQGRPTILKLAPKPRPPSAGARPGQADNTVSGVQHYGAGTGAVAAGGQHSGHKQKLPVGAIVGVVVGCVAGSALLSALGYVVVYRRWYTVNAAQSFKKMHEGPLAAAGGATVSSSAPAASLPSLTSPPAAADGSHTLGGDNQV